jgi:general stress protein 26
MRKYTELKINFMDSINKNQEAQNHEDLQAEKAHQKIKELVEKSTTCFFCTEISTGESDGVRPMSVQKIDENGTLWFLSPSDSHKNQEIEMTSEVKLYFQGSDHSDFLYLKGRAEISKDKTKIKELWEPIFKTWFTGGIDDDRISVVKVFPEDGYYWDTKHGKAIALVKMAIGAIAGKTSDDSIEGKIVNTVS